MKSLMGFILDLMVLVIVLSIVYFTAGPGVAEFLLLAYLAIVSLTFGVMWALHGFKDGLKLLWALQAESFYLKLADKHLNLKL